MTRIAGIEVETKVSLTGALAVVLAFCAVVGGWYRFDSRLSATEAAVQELRQDKKAQQDTAEKLRDTLERLNYTIGVLQQRMDDTRRCDCPSHK